MRAPQYARFGHFERSWFHVCLLMILSMQTQILNSQTFNFQSSPVAFSQVGCTDPFTINASAIFVNGVGTLEGGDGIREVCVTLKAPGESNWVDDVGIYLLPPYSGTDTFFLTVAGSVFPNSGDSLVMTCFAHCSLLDDAATTTDVAPYTNTYNPIQSFASANNNVNSGDGLWRLMICPGSSFAGTLETWSIDFGSLNPQVGIVQTVHPECPGDPTGSFEIPASGFCGPFEYSIDGGSNYVMDSIFTDLPAGPYDICVRAFNGVSTCISTQTLIDDDTEPPMVLCIDQILATPAPGECEVHFIADDFLENVSDNCHVADISYTVDLEGGGSVGPFFSPESFPVPIGLHTFTVTVSDSSGNMSTCMETVLIEEFDPPTCSAMDITVQLDAGGSVSIPPNSADFGSADLCGIASIMLSQTSFGCSEVGQTILVQTVTDSSGNSSTCTATATIEDVTGPQCESMDITVMLDSDGIVTLPNNAIDNGSSDACSIADIVVFPNSLTCDDLGLIILVQTATDINGNTSTCTATATVVDNQDPLLSCSPDITVGTSIGGAGSCEALVNFPLPLATDNCGIDVSAIIEVIYASGSFQSILPFGDPVEEPVPVGEATVTWTVMDLSGNTSSCMHLVTVVDDIDPIVSCPADITASTLGGITPGDCFAEVSIGPVAGADDCPDLIWVSNVVLADGTMFTFNGIFQTIDFFAFPVGVNSIEYVATDSAGNVGSCTRFIFVDDNDPPEFVDCPADITIGTESGPAACEGEALLTSPEATDNCGIMDYTVFYEFADGSTIGPVSYDGGISLNLSFPAGVNTVTYSILDSAETETQCIQTITVVDDMAPEWLDPSLELQLFGICAVDDADDLLQANFPLAVDDCTNPVYHEVSSATTSLCGGGATVTEVQITVDDGINLSPDTFVVLIYLEDVEPPVFSGIPADDVMVSCLDAEFNLFVTADDDCDGSIEVAVDVVNEMFPSCSLGDILETTTYTYTAEDLCGNTSTAVWTIYVFNDLIVDIGPDVTVCPGETTLIDAGIPDAEYLWSNGETTQVIEAGAGTYSVTVTTLGGCCEFDQVEVTESDAPDASAVGGTLDCSGMPISLAGISLTPNVSFSWTGPGGFTSTQQNPIVSQAGTYILTVTSNGGCFSTAEAEVLIDISAPDASALGDTISCLVPTVQLFGASSTPGVTYGWVGPGGFVSNDQNPIVSAAGMYILSVTGPNGCIAMANAVVEADTMPPNAQANAGDVNCQTNEIALLGSSSTAGTTFHWSGPGGFVSDQQNAVTGIQGNYVLTVTAPNGCVATDTVNVQSDITPIVSVITTNLVEAPNTGEASIQLTGGTPPYEIEWDNGETGVEAFMLSVGLHTVTVTDVNDCTQTFSFSMNRLTTVCDFQDDLVATGDMVEGEFNGESIALTSLLQAECVENAFGLPLPEPLEMQSYLFYFRGTDIENVVLTLDALPSDEVRGFVFSCSCAGMFCAQTCIGSFDSDISFQFTDPAGFYYIAIIGPPDASFIMNIEDLNAGPICFVDGSLVCDQEISDIMSGSDNYNTIEPSRNIYRDCYEGTSSFTGPEFAYRMHLTEPSVVTFRATSTARLGMFLYNYLCGRNCIAIAESDPGNPTVELTLELSEGIYFLVLDQSEDLIGQPFTLIAECVADDDDNEIIAPDGITPGFNGFNVVECPLDSSAVHQIRFALTQSNINGMPIANGDRIFFITPEGKIGGRKAGFRWGTGENDFVYEDAQSDSMICGFNVQESFAIYVKQKLNGRIFPVIPSYAEPNGTTITAQGKFIRQGLSLITNLDTDPNAASVTLNVNPPSDQVKSTDLSTIFEIQSNQDWFLSGSTQGFIDSISIVGGLSNVFVGEGSQSIRVHFSQNAACRPRKDTIRVAAGLAPAKLFILSQQGSMQGASIDVVTAVNSDGTGMATANGGMGPYQYLWNTGDTTATTIDSLPDGIYHVTVTDVNGCTSIGELNVTTVGSHDPGLKNNIAVHPNPTSGILQIALSFDLPTDVHLYIHNAVGSSVEAHQFNLALETRESLDISGNPPGVYWLKFVVEGRVHTKRVVLLE